MSDRLYSEPKFDDKRFFRFHKILKKVVDKYGEDILTDYGIVDIIRDMPNEEVLPETLNILERIIFDGAVNFILDHETNSWDEEIEFQLRDYAQRNKLNPNLVVAIGTCIAYSVDMEVEVVPFRSKANTLTRIKLYNEKDLQKLVHCLQDTMVYPDSAKVIPFCDHYMILCLITTDSLVSDDSAFEIRVRACKVDGTTVYEECSEIMTASSIQKGFVIVSIPLNRPFSDKDGIARIEVFANCNLPSVLFM